MNLSKKHLKFIYANYMKSVLDKNGITIDKKKLRLLNSRDKKHVKYLLNTLYGYGLDFNGEVSKWKN